MHSFSLCWHFPSHTEQVALPVFSTKGTVPLWYWSSHTKLAAYEAPPSFSPLSFPPVDTEASASFSPCLFCNHNFPHDTWIPSLQVFQVYASAPPPHLSPRWYHLQESDCLNLCNQLCAAYLQLPVIKVTDVQYQQVCMPLYFEGVNKLRVSFSRKDHSLPYLLSFLQLAACY